MAERTAIAWTDSTVNFWWGCTKVGPGCDHCYAEQWAERTGHHIWGPGVPRRRIKSAIDLMRKLNIATRPIDSMFPYPTGSGERRRRVFVQSMSDIFDLEVPVGWFAEAWHEIRCADRLAIQLVTKRVTAIEKRLEGMVNNFGVRLPWPAHAGLIITVVNQEEADRDIPRALALKAKLGIPWLGLSVEPQIGPIDIREWLGCKSVVIDEENYAEKPSGVDWIISGGESKQGKDHVPRPYDLAWARSLRDQCAAAGVAYFQKQLGSRPCGVWQTPEFDEPDPLGREFAIKDRAGADPAEWPADLRVQQFPEALR